MAIKQRIVGIPAIFEVTSPEGKSFTSLMGNPVEDERIYHFQIYEQYSEEYNKNLNNERWILSKKITSDEVQNLVTNIIIKIFSYPGYEDQEEGSRIDIYEFCNVTLKL